jgi:hypothetical protein
MSMAMGFTPDMADGRKYSKVLKTGGGQQTWGFTAGGFRRDIQLTQIIPFSPAKFIRIWLVVLNMFYFSIYWNNGFQTFFIFPLYNMG